MFAFWESPFGYVDLYYVCMNAGIVCVALVQIVLMLRVYKKIRYLIYIGCYFLAIHIGRYGASFVRFVNDMPRNEFRHLAKSVVKTTGTHFLGHVITFCALFILFAWFVNAFLNEFFKIDMGENADLIRIWGTLSIGLPIQHIFNRLGCLCRGCCHGVKYNGIFALSLPYNSNLDYTVFPSQIVEIVGMVIVTIIGIMGVKKGKHILGRILIGFAVTIFVAEFTIENLQGIRFLGLTMIQLMCLALIAVGVICNGKWNPKGIEKENE